MRFSASRPFVIALVAALAVFLLSPSGAEAGIFGKLLGGKRCGQRANQAQATAACSTTVVTATVVTRRSTSRAAVQSSCDGGACATPQATQGTVISQPACSGGACTQQPAPTIQLFVPFKSSMRATGAIQVASSDCPPPDPCPSPDPCPPLDPCPSGPIPPPGGPGLA